MAMERLFELMQQDILDKAASQSEEGAALLRKGDRTEAQSKLGEVASGIEKAKLIDSLRTDIMARLQDASIEQPPVERLRILFGIQELSEEVSAQPVEPQTSAVRSVDLSAQPPVAAPVINPSAPEATSPETIPSLLNEELLTKYNKREKDVLKNTSQDPEAPTLRSRLATLSFPDETLDKAKRQFGSTLNGMKDKLTKDGLVIVNPIPIADSTHHGVEARYYLTTVEQVANQLTTKVQKGDERQQAPATPRADETSSTEETPPLLNEEILGKYSPNRQSILKNVSQNPLAPTEREQLAKEAYPREQDLNKAKGKLSVAMAEMKKQLAEDGLEIVNASIKAGSKRGGIKASYFLKKIADDRADQQATRTQSPEKPTRQKPDRSARTATTPVSSAVRETIQTPTEEANKNAESTKLADTETYLLAKSLIESTQEVLSEVGVNLAKEDREEIEAVIKRLESLNQDPQNVAEAHKGLFSKLFVYIQNKQKVFMDNLASEDTQFLLAALASLESEEQLKKLLGASSEAEKK